MAMPLPFPTYTVDQVRAFPPDGCRYELVNGMLLVTPQAAYDHQLVLSRVVCAITRYLGEDGPAVAVSPGEIEEFVSTLGYSLAAPPDGAAAPVARRTRSCRE